MACALPLSHNWCPFDLVFPDSHVLTMFLPGFFIHGFPKLIRFQTHHDRILKKFVPKLKKHFDKQGVDSGIYTLKWFFQCFLDRVSGI